MVYISNFTNQDYEVISELGNNSQGGRTVYLAKHIKSKQEVVIKKFSFPQTNADWDGYKIHEKEINILQKLAHERIPRYLDSFPTDDGFCLVQEYKNAPSLADYLAQNRDFKPEEIKKIALSVLDILVYLQQEHPPIYHRDIKPENILVDENLNAYLIDFGVAKVDKNNSIVSSILIGGTLDFMPHEQIHENQSNRVNKSSDLYSLGLTLICLLTKTPSSEIGQFLSAKGVKIVDCKAKIPPLHTDFMKWLRKMIAYDSKDRFFDAKTALNKLQSIPVQGLSFSEKLGNGLKNSLTSFKVIFSIIILGIFGFTATIYIGQKISEAEEKAKEEELAKKRGENVNKLFEIRKCTGCYLSGAYLRADNLSGVDLSSADLSDADLSDANLSSADLSDANLTDANLSSADLSDANLTDANLSSADLSDANLSDANLTDANLSDANLSDANLSDANLKDANLSRADLSGSGRSRSSSHYYKTNLENANLENANLKDANLINSKLENTNLSGANLSGANLSGANLSSANVEDANLSSADLSGVDLSGFDLSGADLSNANLLGANFTNANLSGANFTNANLKDANLKDANFRNIDLTNAIMPNGMVYEEWLKHQ
ncbi:MAG: pentapeptide repeat-containing protein [Crocosphaera sp.]